MKTWLDTKTALPEITAVYGDRELPVVGVSKVVVKEKKLKRYAYITGQLPVRPTPLDKLSQQEVLTLYDVQAILGNPIPDLREDLGLTLYLGDKYTHLDTGDLGFRFTLKANTARVTKLKIVASTQQAEAYQMTLRIELLG